MFEWISDAIDWIGDGISSLWVVLSISLDTFYSNKNYAARKI